MRPLRYSINVTAAAKLTGKGRRTILRLVTRLAKEQPDQVMKEKTPRGYIWKISEQSVQLAYGVSGSPAGATSPVSPPAPPAVPQAPVRSETYIEVALQGYRGMLAMHQEVKQIYEARLRDKDQQISDLTKALEQSRHTWWTSLFGR